MFLGLDIATRTGAARWSYDDPAPRLFTWHLPGTADDLGRPMEVLRANISALHAEEPISHLFFELPIMPRLTQMATMYKLCALAGMAEWTGLGLGAEVRAVEQQKWRKRFIGKGSGKGADLKAMALERARALGWATEDDHQADAAGVLDYGLACFGVATPWGEGPLFLAPAGELFAGGEVAA